MREILLVQLGRLGDLVQTLPVITRFKQIDPACCVTLVCLEDFQGIIKEGAGWDRLVSVPRRDMDCLTDPDVLAAFPHRAPFDRYPEFGRAYDLIVNLTSDLDSAALSEKIAADRKLGRTHANQGEMRLRGPWAKYLHSMVRHRTENIFNLVDIYMGMAGLEAKPQPPSLGVSGERAAQAHDLLLAAGWKGGRPLLAFQTGASDLNRAWDLENFAALGSRLLADGAEIVLVGDSKEMDRAADFRSKVSGPVIDLVGKTGLAQLPALIKACDLLISNDTGTIHVAAAVGTPTLGLFFSTAFYSETAPYGAGHSVLQVEIVCSPCSTSTRCPVQICRQHLTVPEVHASIQWILRPGSRPPPSWPTLSLYRSRFLDNGTLLYAPARPEAPPGQYLTGLLGRLVWEDALGIARDPSLEHGWRMATAGEEWRKKRDALRQTLDSLVDPLNRGLALAGQLRQAFAEGNRDLVRPLHEQMARLAERLSEAGEKSGLFGDFLRFEMMDMDYSPYPELAVQLEDKYRALCDWIARVGKSLDRL